MIPTPTTIEDYAAGAKVYTNGDAAWFYRRGKWSLCRINGAGKPYDWHWTHKMKRAEVEALAESAKRRAARERAELAPSSSDFFFAEKGTPRPSRTPYFFRKQAIIWARHHRRNGLLSEDGGALYLAKTYLKDYRESVAVWHARYGV